MAVIEQSPDSSSKKERIVGVWKKVGSSHPFPALICFRLGVLVLSWLQKCHEIRLLEGSSQGLVEHKADSVNLIPTAGDVFARNLSSWGKRYYFMYWILSL